MVHTVATGDNQDKPYLCDCEATFDTATELNELNRTWAGCCGNHIADWKSIIKI